MMKRIMIIKSIAGLAFLLGFSANASAVPTVTLGPTTATFPSGDYDIRGDNSGSKTPQQICQTSGSPGDNKVCADTDTVASLQAVLELEAANTLVFGVFTNQEGGEVPELEQFDFTIDSVTYSLGLGDRIGIPDYHPGSNNEPEAILTLLLNGDLYQMSGSYTLLAQFDNDNDGPDRVEFLLGLTRGANDECLINPSLPQCGPMEVPEPGTLALLGLGLAGMGFARRRRKI